MSPKAKKKETAKASEKPAKAAAAPKKAGKAAPAPIVEVKAAPAEGGEEEMDEDEVAASSSGSGGGNAAALAAASSTTESASFKNFRHHPDMENFYRFIYENDLRLEALAIIDEMAAQKTHRKVVKGAKAQPH